MIVDLDSTIQDICRKFANDVVSSNKDEYARRKQFNINKIIDDIYIGKLAEFATYKILKTKRDTVTVPDIGIYSKNRKSFSADLTMDSYSIHVKARKTEFAKKYNLSWSFQAYDSLIKSPTEYDLISFCVVISSSEVDVKRIVQANKLINLYKDPELVKLHGIKKVLYWDDIKIVK